MKCTLHFIWREIRCGHNKAQTAWTCEKRRCIVWIQRGAVMQNTQTAPLLYFPGFVSFFCVLFSLVWWRAYKCQHFLLYCLADLACRSVRIITKNNTEKHGKGETEIMKRKQSGRETIRCKQRKWKIERRSIPVKCFIEFHK